MISIDYKMKVLYTKGEHHFMLIDCLTDYVHMNVVETLYKYL